ncbi:unnamed protein product, partial [Adineta steineri]
IKEPTEIYIPPLQFPQQGYNVTVNAVLKWKIDPLNSNIILVESNVQLVKSNNPSMIGVVEICPKV